MKHGVKGTRLLRSRDNWGRYSYWITTDCCRHLSRATARSAAASATCRKKPARSHISGEEGDGTRGIRRSGSVHRCPSHCICLIHSRTGLQQLVRRHHAVLQGRDAERWPPEPILCTQREPELQQACGE
jgi:hypothetical protein